MKKKLLLLALSCAASSAFAKPELYGRLSVSFESFDDGGDAVFQLESNTSRIGLRGDVNTDVEDLTAFYLAEYEIAGDDGTIDGDGDSVFRRRDIFLGLKGSWGSGRAGTYNTPSRNVQNKVDLFHQLPGDLMFVFENEVRVANQINYTSSPLGPIVVSGSYVSSESATREDGFSGAIMGDFSEAIYVGVGFDQNVYAPDSTTVRLVGQFQAGAFQLGAMFESYDQDLMEDAFQSVFGSLKWDITDLWSLKTQFGMQDRGGDDNTADTFSVGADYKLSKNIKSYLYYTSNNEEVRGVNTVEETYAGIGLELNF